MKGLKELLKKGLCGALSIALLFPGMPVYAATETSISIDVSSTTIDITVPLNFACAIDPNKEDGFSYADNFTVTNNTKAPITLTASDFSDASNTFENDILPDGLPEGKTWDTLSVNGTKKYFSLGIYASDTNEWINYYPTNIVYAKNVQDAAVPLGAINPNQSVNFGLDASYGRAVKQGFTFSYKITWLAELFDENNEPVVSQEALNFEIIEEYNSLPNFLDDIMGVEVVHADEIVTYDGTCKIVGINSSFDELTTYLNIPSSYEKDGKVYKVVEIAANAFSGNAEGNTNASLLTNINKIKIPDTVETIGRLAFSNNSRITSVTIPENVTFIDAMAFANCQNLASIDILSDNFLVEAYAFHNLANEAKIYVNDETLAQKFIDYYYINNTTEILAKNNEKKILETIQMGDNIVGTLYRQNNINYLDIEGTGSMYNYAELPPYVETLNQYTNIICNIGNGITDIGDHTFHGTFTLKSVYFGDDIETVGVFAFENSKVSTIILNDKVKTLKEKAFKLTKINSIVLPESLETIEANVFEQCANLETLTIPNSVTYIGNSAINNCPKLSIVNVLGNPVVGAWIFYESGLSSPNGLKVYVLNDSIRDSWSSQRADNFYSDCCEFVTIGADSNIYYNNSKYSIWNWYNETITDYNEFLDFCTAKNISIVYQSISIEMLENNKEAIESYVAACEERGITLYALWGDPRMCHDWNYALTYTNALQTYNWGREEHRITNIMLDNEVYTISDYLEREDYYNDLYIKTSKYIYNNIKSKGYNLAICVGATELQDHPELKVIYTDYCDEIAVMNYYIASTIQNITPVVEIGKAYNKPIISIAEFNKNESSYHQFNNLQDARDSFKEMAEHFKFDRLSFSYHWYGEIKDM